MYTIVVDRTELQTKVRLTYFVHVQVRVPDRLIIMLHLIITACRQVGQD